MKGRRVGLWQAASTLGLAFESRARGTEVLEQEHPFARALDLLRVLLRQSLAVAAVLLVAAVAVPLGAGWARTLLVPVVVVQLGLALGLAIAAARLRAGAEELIVEGRAWLPLRLLARQRDRLLDRRTRESLARSFEDLVHTATRWHKILRASPPVWSVQLVRELASDLLAIAALLRADTTDARGVVLAKRLLFDGSSPLYGAAVDELQVALRQIADALTDETAGTA